MLGRLVKVRCRRLVEEDVKCEEDMSEGKGKIDSFREMASVLGSRLVKVR